MIEIETFRKIALSFPETDEEHHNGSSAFKVRGRIFATIDMLTNRACLQFSAIAQDVYASFDESSIYPVPEACGSQGWTFLDLSNLCWHVLSDALTTAYCENAPNDLADQIRQAWDE